MNVSPQSQPLRKFILFVDDDEDMRNAMYEMFSPRYQVALAVDGLDGYTKANGPSRPDLIIADVAMPQLDGIEMAKRIRENLALRLIPIIFLTGQMSPASLMAGLSLGSPFAYLAKSTDPRVLETKVRHALGEA
jgi:two-component system sensor histidine kinase and response regulator WspE